MKNTLKTLGIIALFAVIGFSMAACSNGAGGGNNNKDKDTGGEDSANVRIKILNNGGIVPDVGRAINARAVGSYGTDDSSFAKFTEVYSNLGTPKKSITPTKFILAGLSIGLCSPNVDIYDLFDGQYLMGGPSTTYDEDRVRGPRIPYCDFVNETTITVGDIPSGFTCAAIYFTGLDMIQSGFIDGVSRVEFEWPGGQTAFDDHNRFNCFGTGTGTGTGYQNDLFPPNQQLPIWNENKVTVTMSSIKRGLSASDSGLFPSYNNLIYDTAETQRRYFDGAEAYSSIIIPFNSVKIPSSGTVTFNISWDMTDMIEVYEGATASANDDIFVLKNGFWESFYIHVTYE